MKSSLVIDGNYLLYKDVFILVGMKTLYSDLRNLLKKDLNTLIKMHSYDTIYFVSDSKLRWRKEYYNEYKENRKPDSKIDWGFVYREYDIFKDEIKKLSNVKSYEIDWAEGDDLVAHITRENNKKGISTVIISADGDLHQLIKFDLGLGYINIMYNYKFSDERTYWPGNYNVFLKEMDKSSTNSLFDMNDDTEILRFLEDLEFKTKKTEVYPEESLFCKMVQGDKKDNVPTVYMKNDRGIGKTGGLSIYKLYKETNNEIIDFDSDIFINRLTDIISYSKKIIDDDIKIDIKKNLIRNRKLLCLTENYLPIEIRKELVNKIKI